MTAKTLELVSTTVAILKMWVSGVNVSNSLSSFQCINNPTQAAQSEVNLSVFSSIQYKNLVIHIFTELNNNIIAVTLMSDVYSLWNHTPPCNPWQSKFYV